MIRVRTFALIGALLITPASAQIMVAQPPPPQIQVQTVSTPNAAAQPDSDAFMKTMTIEEAQRRIAQLNREKRELDAKLTETLATLDEWTRKGGSLVHAYCESEDVSRSSAGATENCAETGYRCAPVEGTCRRSCNVTTDCAGYHVCDTAAHVCVHT